MQQKQCQQLDYIYRDFAKAENSPSSVFIRLLTIRYKRQDGGSNGGSVGIQSVVCVDDTWDSVRIRPVVRKDDT